MNDFEGKWGALEWKGLREMLWIRKVMLEMISLIKSFKATSVD